MRMPFLIRKLNAPRSIGEELSHLRREQNLTLSEMAEKTKVRKQLLGALEKGAVADLPERLYTRNLFRTYVKTLMGNEAYFLNRFDEEWGSCDVPHFGRVPFRRAGSRAFLSPSKIIAFFGIAAACFSVMAYLGLEVLEITSPPDIQVSSPSDGFTTDQAIIRMTGKTKPNVSLKVNGSQILLSKDGSFETEIALERGLNVVAFEGSKRYSKATRMYRHIVFQQNHTALSGIAPVDN